MQSLSPEQRQARRDAVAAARTAAAAATLQAKLNAHVVRVGCIPEPPPSMKLCRRCECVKLRSDFTTATKERDGLQHTCKTCRKPHVAASKKKSRSTPESKERAREYRAQYKDRECELRQAWEAANFVRRQEYKASWYAENKHRYNDYVRKYQTRKSGAFVEDVDRVVVWKRDGGICRLCGRIADPNAWHLEHLTPLSHGGEHSYANTAVSHPVCNLKKHDKTLAEWEAL